VNAYDAVKVAGLLFAAAILQASLFASFDIFGAAPDLLLVTLVGVALLRGSIVGSAAGFFGGLVLDTANLETLGFTSLMLTVAGYWIGRYGETTGRGRAHAPVVSVAVVTCLYALAILMLHFLLDETAPAGAVVRSLVPAVTLNLLLCFPVYALCRRLLPPLEWGGRVREVRLLG
jgi:rod shape-determining protein MreD